MKYIIIQTHFCEVQKLHMSSYNDQSMTLHFLNKHRSFLGLFYDSITRYGSTLYIGIAMVVPIPQYIRKCQFLLSVSSEFDF